MTYFRQSQKEVPERRILELRDVLAEVLNHLGKPLHAQLADIETLVKAASTEHQQTSVVAAAVDETVHRLLRLDLDKPLLREALPQNDWPDPEDNLVVQLVALCLPEELCHKNQRILRNGGPQVLHSAHNERPEDFAGLVHISGILLVDASQVIDGLVDRPPILRLKPVLDLDHELVLVDPLRQRRQLLEGSIRCLAGVGVLRRLLRLV